MQFIPEEKQIGVDLHALLPENSRNYSESA
jgi:hypothetical protein